MVIALNVPHSAPSSLEVLLPPIIGGLLALMGVLIAEFWAARRESVKAKFEWRKFLFEHYEQYYREFILGLASTLNADQIKQYFNRLNTSALVPDHLGARVRETIHLLESNTGPGQKTAERDKLLREFKQFMQEPWTS